VESLDFKIEPIQSPNLGRPLSRRPFWNLGKTKLVIIGLAVLLVVAIVFFFLGRGSFREGNVELNIEGPKEISAGESVSYKVTYKNNNKIVLTGVKLNFFYPADAIVTRDQEVLNITNEDFEIGELKSGESGERTLAAFIVGDRGNIKTARATLTFKPSNLSSVFQKEASLATTITSLAVPITLVAPPTVINGQNISYLVDYRNQSREDLSDLRFQVRYPEGFKPNKFTPQPTTRGQSQDIWEIPVLKQGDGSRITIQGILSGNERETKTVSVVLQKKTTTATGVSYIDFEKTDASSVISTPLLSVGFVLNDSADYTAHLSDLLRYEVNFKNNSDADIANINLSVRLDGNMFDSTTVQSDGFFDSRQSTIFWNGSTVSELNNLRPRQSVTVKFDVRLKSGFSGGVGARDSFVKASAHLETPNVPANLDIDKLTADSELVTRISTSPAFSQKILLKDSVFGSSGPFPPEVNKKTVFTVRWNLINPSNDLMPAKVTAVLMPGVVWEGQARVNGSQPQPVYAEGQKTVTWDLGTLPAGVGVSFLQYETDFQISITPSVNQVGQTAPLLKSVRFDGTDTFTGEKISRTMTDVTTSNVGDSSESGSVRE
jgi:hypothetical protein